MLNITHYQRNANQNHNEVPFHTSQNGCDPKVYKQLLWRATLNPTELTEEGNGIKKTPHDFFVLTSDYQMHSF